MSTSGSDLGEADDSASPAPDHAAFRARLKHFAHSTPVGGPSTRAVKRQRENQDQAVPDIPLATPSPTKRPAKPLDEGTPKKKRKAAKERSKNDPYSPENKLVDSLQPGLILVFIGLNPGLKTAETGHAYAHPSNRFWHLLYESGVTPRKYLPSETHDLLDLSIGNTNICARPTRDGSGLSKEELAEGAGILEDKIRTCRPEAVCIVGKQIWEALWLARTGQKLKKDKFKWGWQDEDTWLGKTQGADGKTSWSGARTFVATSTSGLSASMRPHEKLAVWRPLGDWFIERKSQAEVGQLVDDGGPS